MKILAVDTATQSCSVAVLDSSHLVAELTHNHGLTHTRRLMPMIDSSVRQFFLFIKNQCHLAPFSEICGE